MKKVNESKLSNPKDSSIPDKGNVPQRYQYAVTGDIKTPREAGATGKPSTKW